MKATQQEFELAINKLKQRAGDENDIRMSQQKMENANLKDREQKLHQELQKKGKDLS